LRSTWLTLFKGVIATVLLCILVLFTSGFSKLSYEAYGMLWMSGIVGISLGDSAFFASLPKIGVSLTAAIQCLAPLITALGAALFLGERLEMHHILGILVTSLFLAVLILSERPVNANIGEISPQFRGGLLLAALAAFCQAIGVLMARTYLEGLSAAEGALHRMLMSVVVILIWELSRTGASVGSLVQEFSLMPHRGPLVVAGVLGTFFGLIFMVYGMTHAPVGIAVAISSTYPIWVTLLERMIFRKPMKLISLFCLCGSIAGVCLLVM
ncbi:MAG: DMT family transporter, partial [Proteobacteria bacterium]|nr:DMT family transporter [Pseudomonadota bacterium]